MTVSTLKPIARYALLDVMDSDEWDGNLLGIVETTSPSYVFPSNQILPSIQATHALTCNWYNIVVLPAASKPTIKMRTSWSLRHFVNEASESKIVLNVSPMKSPKSCGNRSTLLLDHFQLEMPYLEKNK